MPVTDEAATARPAVTLTARGAAWRFLRALVRLTVLLVPEYLVVVLLVGGLRGGSSPSVVASSVPGCCWCSSLRWSARSLVIPTAGGIPILQGLAVAGLSQGALGALLITLPAVSLPGMAMVWRAFGWRVTMMTASVVAFAGVVSAGLMAVL